MWVTKKFLVPIDFYSISHTMEVNGDQATNILQNIIFHVQQKQKLTTGLVQLEGE